MRIFLVCTFLVASGCASSAPPPVRSRPVAVVVEPPPPPPERHGEIVRAELVPVIEAGLGRFLGGVRVEAALTDGRFEGYRIVSIYPTDPRFEGLELVAGDVVVRVNGEPIERPEQAFHVWNGLRVASELMIEYVRGGERRELRYAIVD
jgi:S1-C subfamily serine protease